MGTPFPLLNLQASELQPEAVGASSMEAVMLQALLLF